MEHMYDIQMTYSRYKTLLHCQQQQTPPPVSPTVSPSHRFHCWVSPALFFLTTGFKFFQTSVAFHRGMAVQHKAESRHAPSNQTAEALPGNRACSGTPTHWGLSSAVTFSGSHLVSPWKKKRGKKTTSTHFQENLDFWDVFCFYCVFRPSRPSLYFLPSRASSFSVFPLHRFLLTSPSPAARQQLNKVNVFIAVFSALSFLPLRVSRRRFVSSKHTQAFFFSSVP